MEGFLTKKNILGRKNTQYYVLDPKNFKISYGQSKKKLSKAINLLPSLDQEDSITPHLKNDKKFIICMGSGKNSYQLKFEAGSQ